ncbi:jg23878 [Pararge aegeria aegeria]|uniref:Jg23878 protein n=1 Tax=Pararge aegeria aegeria TaxID=348720 RepID=A0A8S4RQU3_9NEOP|nr:jg23878 [Pararge aegeria aegeria]
MIHSVGCTERVYLRVIRQKRARKQRRIAGGCGPRYACGRTCQRNITAAAAAARSARFARPALIGRAATMHYCDNDSILFNLPLTVLKKRYNIENVPVKVELSGGRKALYTQCSWHTLHGGILRLFHTVL